MGKPMEGIAQDASASSYEIITPFQRNHFAKMKENQYLNLSQVEHLHSKI